MMTPRGVRKVRDGWTGPVRLLRYGETPRGTTPPCRTAWPPAAHPDTSHILRVLSRDGRRHRAESRTANPGRRPRSSDSGLRSLHLVLLPDAFGPAEAPPMSDAPLVQIRRALVEGVAVVDLLPREITEPHEAARMGAALVAAFELGAA